MSINKSLKISILTLSTLPLLFMAVLTYAISYGKYIELAKDSAAELAMKYSDGFATQLNAQIAEIEGLSGNTSIQSLALDSYNGISAGEDSAYYEAASGILNAASSYMGDKVSFYLYDVNGYYMLGTSDGAHGDWSEYMDTPIDEINKTMILNSANINTTESSIDLIAPVTVKGKTVALIRENISVSFFGSFISDENDSFIYIPGHKYLFNSKGFSDDDSMEYLLEHSLAPEGGNGYLSKKSMSIEELYGYNSISINDTNLLYIIKPDTSSYKKILSALPFTFLLTFIIILAISYHISVALVSKYTKPILILKDNMNEAANGNLNVKCPIKSNDEFGELSKNFNSMMNIISSNYTELEESKKALESKQQELEKNYAHIEQLAYHDGLTGLYNRVAFMKLANEILKNEGSILNKHAIFFLDLDNFKNVNDTLGHDYGDTLLCRVAEEISAILPPDNILARTGGDEFLILQPNCGERESLAAFADRLVKCIEKPFDLGDETAHVSLSVGISLFPHDGLTITELIKNSDIAMYMAKGCGKNNYRFFTSYMEDDFNRKNDLSGILENVIDKNEVYLMYQPQVNVINGEITGYEALMRIESDLAGFISPAEFIPIAEENGMIDKLGEWALYEACTFNQKLLEDGHTPIKVSVNVSTKQLKDDSLIEIVKSIPEKTGMELKYLEIEITESVLMNSFTHNLELIEKLKELGVSIALDDFGTGYSSFNYLTQIPIDTLKIDKSFIDGICNNEKDKYIADSIINLAHKMNISVVAEGVESIEQLKILQKQFCDTLQGYLFSKPLHADEFVELVKNIEKRRSNKG